VAKILVADDNSNVQKTVALALADLGVEVVAVNNGDAAVRKLGDVKPDLVLADIFMPVRNGYEVCEYVKKDSRFAHVPVVLLVGAFDPLDEREAQRVGADGILKKPFVPPDPLIAMVKTLLDRSLNEKLVTVGAGAKPAATTQTSAAGKAGAVKIEERPAPPAQAASPVMPELSPEPVAEEEIHPAADRLSFGEGEAPVAFGQLLDPPVAESTEIEAEAQAIEPVEDDQVLTSTRDANLGEPAFWKAEEPEAEEGEGETESEEDDSSHDFSRSWGLGEDAVASHESGESAHAAEPAETDADEPLELVRDGDEEAGSSPSIVEPSASFAQDAASQASLHVQAGRADDLAANPLEWMATAPTQHGDETPVENETGGAWTAEEAESSEGTEFSAEPAEAEPEPVEEMQLEPQSFELPEPPAPPIPAPPPLTSPIGVMAPASFLGTSIPSAKPPVPPPASSVPSQSKTDAPASDPDQTLPPFKRTDPSAEDTAHSIPLQQWADLTAGLERPAPPAQMSKPPASPAPASQASRPNASSSPASPSSADSAAPDPALVEAVVQRVLDKMRPQVVDIITKEFLRPVVQALVHREINREPTKH